MLCGLLCVAVLLALALAPYFYIRHRAGQRLPASFLKNKSVVITGCDTGFGNLTAQRLAKSGDMTIFAGCLTQKGLDDLRALSPPNLIPFLLDVTKQESIDEAYELVKKGLRDEKEGLFAVINNAGLLRGGLLEATPLSDFHLMFAVNVFGMAMVTKKFIPLLRRCKDSRVINIASVAGRLALSGISAYSGTKHAVEALSDSLRRELYPWGIRVVIIEPGIMKTPLYDQPLKESVDSIWAKCDIDTREAYGREWFEKTFEESKKLLDTVGGNPTLVVDALEEAVTSACPAHRRSVGMDAHFVWIPFSYLPTWLSDPLLRLLEGHPIPQALKK